MRVPVQVPASPTVQFSSLNKGDPFMYSGNFLQKTGDATLNAINLATGDLVTLAGQSQITLVAIQLAWQI